jgi:thiamine biosynthesis protein ThiS
VEVVVNGEPRQVDPKTSLTDLVSILNLPAKRIAVELNRTVIRRVDWSNTWLNEGDRVEIVHFVGGGAR